MGVDNTSVVSKNEIINYIFGFIILAHKFEILSNDTRKNNFLQVQQPTIMLQPQADQLGTLQNQQYFKPQLSSEQKYLVMQLPLE